MSELDRRIKALCEAKGLRFRPWEFPPPWEIGDNESCPYLPHTAAAAWWLQALALRAVLKEELEQQ